MKFKSLILASSVLLSPCVYSQDIIQQSDNEYYETQRLASVISHINHLYIKEVSYHDMIDNAIDGLLKNLDPHSAFLDEESLKQLNTQTEGQFVGVGIEFVREDGNLKIISPLDGSPALNAGIKAGDVITHVDNKYIHNLKLMDAINLIKGKIGTKVILKVYRKSVDKSLDIPIVRDTIKVTSTSTKTIADHYAYIRISSFNEPTADEVKNAVKKAKNNKQIHGIILDLRNNPGGLLHSAVDIANIFLDAKTLGKNKKIVFTKGRHKEDQFVAYANNGEIAENLPVIVLINEGSASASEILAIALQEHDRAVLIGKKSFGKGSVQSVFPIDDKTAIKLTTSLYYSPMGNSIQAQGVIPDISVPFDKINQEQSNQSSENTYESSLPHHLIANESSHEKFDQSWSQFKKRKEALMTLAKEDYYIYQAILVLQGIKSFND